MLKIAFSILPLPLGTEKGNYGGKQKKAEHGRVSKNMLFKTLEGERKGVDGLLAIFACVDRDSTGPLLETRSEGGTTWPA